MKNNRCDVAEEQSTMQQKTIDDECETTKEVHT